MKLTSVYAYPYIDDDHNFGGEYKVTFVFEETNLALTFKKDMGLVEVEDELQRACDNLSLL